MSTQGSDADPASTAVDGARVETRTVLFTDVVGATELRQRIGEEAADGLQGAHDDLLRQAVEANGGEVVKGLGDGVLAVFSSAADAVAAAVASQQAVEGYSRREEEFAFSIRVGVSTGDVATTEDDVFGAAVVEASRLCDAAGPGQIVVADVVRALTRGRGSFTFEALGELTLKGLSEPVSASSVMWEFVAEPDRGPVPFPQLLSPPALVPYVGRAELVAALDSTLRSAVRGEGSRGVLLVGEPGVGKTRTAATIARRAFEEGALVLYGRCDEGIAVPYQPFVEAIDWQTQHESALPLGRLPGELARLVPELGARVAGLPDPVASDPRVEEHRLFQAVVSWLDELSREWALVLVIDDLHWATKPTLQLLVHVLRGLAASPEARLLLLATYRDTDVARTHPLIDALGDLRRLPTIDRRRVDALTEEEAVTMMAEAAGHELDADALRLARLAYRETDGNPLFVGEMMRHFIETGVARIEDGRWVVDEPEAVDVPESVRDVVGRRLNRLSSATNEMLGLAAVVGQDVDVAVLALLVEAGEGALLDALDEALHARILEEAGPDRVSFAHALVRTILYEELSSSRRRRVHSRVVDVLEEVRPDDVAALARHAIRAGPIGGNLDRAITYALAAGDRALAQRAAADARGWFDRVLELREEAGGGYGRERLQALCGLGEAQRDQGDQRYRETLLRAGREALGADELDLAVRAAVSSSRFFLSIVGAVDEERVALLEEVLARLGPERNLARAQVLALLSVELTFVATAAERRVELADEATAIADEIGDPGVEAAAAITTWIAVNSPRRTGDMPDRQRRAVELSDVSGDPTLRAMARFTACLSLLGVGAVVDARARAEEARGIAEETAPVFQWMSRCLGLQFSSYDGDLEAARRENDAALELGQRIEEPDAMVWWGATLGGLGFVDGSYGDLADAAASFADEYPDNSGWRSLHVAALARAGREDEAREALLRCGFDDAGAVPEDWVWLPTVAFLSAAAFDLSLPELGDQLLHRVRPFRELWSHIGTLIIEPVELTVARAAAAAGRPQEAVDAASRAYGLVEDAGLRSHLPRVAVAYVRGLRLRGRTEDLVEAEMIAGPAIATAEAMGMARIASELRRLVELE